MRCIHCSQEKSLEEFNYRDKALEIRQKTCRICTKLQVRSHYENNRQYYLDKARKRNKKIREEIKNYIWTYLSSHQCSDCGEKDPIVLEFDHIRDKSFTIASLGRNHTLEVIKTEIAKCEVRCANCHRRKTAKQFGWHKNIMRP